MIRKTIVIFILMSIGLWFAGQPFNSVLAHQPFASYVRHHSNITIKPNYIDVIHQLTLSNDQALQLRRLIDVDKNSSISSYEVNLFKSNQHELIRDGLIVGFDHKALPFKELYSPDIDFHDNKQVEASPVVLTNYWFIEIPKGQASFLITNEYYSEIPAVWTWDVEIDEKVKPTVECNPIDPRFIGSNMIVSESISAVSRTIKIDLINILGNERE